VNSKPVDKPKVVPKCTGSKIPKEVGELLGTSTVLKITVKDAPSAALLPCNSSKPRKPNTTFVPALLVFPGDGGAGGDIGKAKTSAPTTSHLWKKLSPPSRSQASDGNSGSPLKSSPFALHGKFKGAHEGVLGQITTFAGLEVSTPPARCVQNKIRSVPVQISSEVLRGAHAGATNQINMYSDLG
jgi:hypothetical protein